AVSTVTELGKDEVWLQGWLREQPSRLGLGELEVTDGVADDEDRSLVATDEGRCFSVDVQLGEMEASRGFQVLDNWARNRVRHPDKTHVAVLVTEVVSDRYETTLQTLAEHLPLVVVELQVWKGENEAIVVPHIALSSDEVDLSNTPAAKAAEIVSRNAAAGEPEHIGEPEPIGEPDVVSDAGSVADDQPEYAQPEGEYAQPEGEYAQPEGDVETSDDAPENKDDTGVGNPWGFPDSEAEAEAEAEEGQGNGTGRLLNKVG
ncbi:MAG: hypothetical protein PVH07_06050, partial [Chloroflexota bacterium]